MKGNRLKARKVARGVRDKRRRGGTVFAATTAKFSICVSQRRCHATGRKTNASNSRM